MDKATVRSSRRSVLCLNSQNAGWTVLRGTELDPHKDWWSSGSGSHFPQMVSDAILVNPEGARLAIETKVTDVVSPTRVVAQRFRTSHVAQVCRCLRTKEHLSEQHRHARWLLLYPSIEKIIDETVPLQGHDTRFATVDLTATASRIAPLAGTCPTSPRNCSAPMPAIHLRYAINDPNASQPTLVGTNR